MNSKRLNTIKTIVRHPDISLFTLNAPQSSMNGVTPLGMAAWLNMADAVRLLLEESSDTISVDGMDTHGATGLMCKPDFFGFFVERYDSQIISYQMLLVMAVLRLFSSW
jgi:hypothetical protein